MDNQEIIRRLWERDTIDSKIVDKLYSTSVNTKDNKMSYGIANFCQKRIGEFRSDLKKACAFYEIFENALNSHRTEI